MQNVSYRKLLQPAQSAARTGNWSLLIECLQDLLSGDRPIALEDLLSDEDTATEFLALALQGLQFGTFHQNWEIAKILSSLNSRKVPSSIREVLITRLVVLLQDAETDSEVQWFAIRILSEFDHPRIIQSLIEVLQTSDNDELQTAAIAALSKLGNTAIPVMQELLDDPATRRFAMQVLGQIRHSEIIPLLFQVVTDPDAQVRAIAIETLGSFHSPKITSTLVQALKDPIVPVRRAAVTGLGFCHPEDALDIDLVTQLRPLLFDLNLEVCRQTVLALGRLATPSSIAALADVLRSPHTPEILAIEIIRALGWSNTSEGLNALNMAFSELTLTEAVRLEILTILGRLEASELKVAASQLLMQALQNHCHESERVKQAIALSLGQVGTVDAIEPLIHLLSDPDVGVRLHTVSALKTLDSEKAHQRLQELASLQPAESPLGKGIAIALKEWAF